MNFDSIIVKVKENPVLWQSKHPYYRRRAVLSKTWREISHKLDVDENILRKRWKHLKDQYRKELKKMKVFENGPSDEPESTWQYFQDLSFLRDEMLQRDTVKVTVLSDSESHHASSDESDIPISETKKQKINEVSIKQETNAKPEETPQENKKINLVLKRLRTINESMDNFKANSSVSHNDPDQMFFASLLPTVRKLTDIQKLQFRGKINEWLLETLTQNEYQNGISEECDNKLFVQSQIRHFASEN